MHPPNTVVVDMKLELEAARILSVLEQESTGYLLSDKCQDKFSMSEVYSEVVSWFSSSPHRSGLVHYLIGAVLRDEILIQKQIF